MTELGRLKRIDLRKAWANEAGDFTPWLSQEENIKLLGDTIGIELEVQGTEKEVGPYRADILCKETTTDHWVLVENQLEKTDHTHLGQLMTYAAGLNAVTIVWVSAHFTEEHRAALDWLNEITGEGFAFFGLEVELWQIGTSPIAPKFNVVSKPNEWVRVVSARKSQNEPPTETQEKVLAFWSSFKDYLSEHSEILSIKTPWTRHWQTFALGRSGFALVAIVNTKAKRVFCYLATSGSDSKPYYYLLEEEKEAIEREFGESLDWRPMLNKNESHVHVAEFNTDPLDESKWPEQHQWLSEKLERLHRVFAPRIKKLDADDYMPEDDG